MADRFLIIANPIAGGGRGRKRGQELAAALAELGCEADLYLTGQAGDARGRAAEIDADEYRGLISVGGDGTLNEVLNGMPDPTLPLGTLPLGTANVLAKELHLPRKPKQVAELVANGQTCRAAIGLAGGRRFLLFASVGLDASIVERLEEVRSGTLGKLKWSGPILHTIRRWPIRQLRVTTVEGNTVEDCSIVLVTRVRNYGGVCTLPSPSPSGIPIHIGDGKLHVLAFRQQSRCAYATAVLRGLVGRLRPGQDLIALSTTALRIEGEDVPYQLDGDLGGRLTTEAPLEVSLHGKSAHIYAPPRALV